MPLLHTSWLPYSTYQYLDFYLLCSMTKLKEHSREICYLHTQYQTQLSRNMVKVETNNSTYSTICVFGWVKGDVSPGILAFERNLIIQRINETTHDPARLNISLDSPKDPWTNIVPKIEALPGKPNCINFRFPKWFEDCLTYIFCLYLLNSFLQLTSRWQISVISIVYFGSFSRLWSNVS